MGALSRLFIWLRLNLYNANFIDMPVLLWLSFPPFFICLMLLVLFHFIRLMKVPPHLSDFQIGTNYWIRFIKRYTVITCNMLFLHVYNLKLSKNLNIHSSSCEQKFQLYFITLSLFHSIYATKLDKQHSVNRFTKHWNIHLWCTR